MRLSKQLEIDHECGDFGKALEGYSERAKELERIVWDKYYNDAFRYGCSHEEAVSRADEVLETF